MSDVLRTLAIGRAKDCDLLLTHSSVSRHHAELTLGTRGGVRIRDLQSTGGTFVVREGREIPAGETQLKMTDTLRFGDYDITLSDLLLLIPPEKPVQAGPSPIPPPKPRMMRCACGVIKERGKPCPDCGL